MNNYAIDKLQAKDMPAASFALCGSCFWCASALRAGLFSACPSCKGKQLDVMPISKDESYVFSHDERRGIVLDFVPSKRK